MSVTSVHTADVQLPAVTHTSALTFTTDRATLLDALASVALAVAQHPVVPVLAGVLLDGRDGHLTVSATDYETAVSAHLPGAVCTPGAIVVDHAEITRLLGALIKGMSKREADRMPVIVRATGGGTPVVDLAGYTMPITSYPIDAYPSIPEAPLTVAQVDRAAFASEAARVLIAVAADDTLPVLTNVHMEISPGALTLAATDRFRLAIGHLPALSSTQPSSAPVALVSGRLINALVKRFTAEHVRIGLNTADGASTVSFACGEITVITQTSIGQFPNYRQLLPHEAVGTVQTERAAILTATRRAAAVLDAKHDASAYVKLTVTPTSVSVAPVLVNHVDMVAAPQQDADIDGVTEVMTYCFRPRHLVDALNSFTGDTITLHTQASLSRPVLFTDTPLGLSAGSSFRHLVMPVRLKDS